MAATKLPESTYSWIVGVVFIINLVSGTGPLTLPYCFERGGLYLSAFFMAFVAFVAFITASFSIEAMSSSNALSRCEGHDAASEMPLLAGLEEKREYEGIFLIRERIEIGRMAELLTPERLQNLLYGILIVYTIGCLSVYIVGVADALTKMYPHFLLHDAYPVWVTVFGAVVTPISMGNFQSTRYLQIGILCLRASSVGLMLFASTQFVVDGKGASLQDLPKFNLKALPELFGQSIFTFMIHHSISGLVSPIRPQKRMLRTVFTSYSCAVLMYYLICGMAMFAFNDIRNNDCLTHPSAPCDIQELYSMNFASYNLQWLASYLDFYPVLLATTYPLVCITLRNNLMLLVDKLRGRKATASTQTRRQVLYAILASCLPICISLSTRNVQLVSSITGAYPGLAIMFLIPCCLVYYGRKRCKAAFGDLALKHPFRSPFSHPAWLWAVVGFTFICVVFNTVYLSR